MYIVILSSKNLVETNLCSTFAIVNKKQINTLDIKQIIIKSGGNSNTATRS